MLETFNTVINYLVNALKGDFSAYVIISLTISQTLIFIIELIISLTKRPKKSHVYNFLFSCVLLIVQSYFSVSDYLNKSLLFVSAWHVYTYLSICVLLCVIYSTALYLIYDIKRKKAVKKPRKPLEVAETLSPSKVETYFTTDGVLNGNGELSGWLNVSHLKGLLKELKTKNLNEEELKEVEDFEVYLLNFINRQPNAYERKILSGQINLLFKKIARYTG
ncbi:MAG: hypothetical protein IKL82_04945 [Clostridia bacterium]|nr:hypothetical protein [Clostridia bacterium]